MNLKYIVSERRLTQKALYCVMPFYGTFWKRQKYWGQKVIVRSWDLLKRGTGEIFEMMNMLCVLPGSGYTVCIQNYTLRKVNFTVCKIYLIEKTKTKILWA